MESDLLKDLPLTDDDKEFLNANFDCWEPVAEDGKHGIIIHEYTLPEKYTPECSDLMIIIPNDYPASALDMFYFSPDISRKDEGGIDHLASEHHFGQSWQRWSRHYTWDPNIHNIVHHMFFVRYVLEEAEN